MTKREAMKRLEADLAGTDLLKVVTKMIKWNLADFYWSRKLEAYFIEIKGFDFAAGVYDLYVSFVPDKTIGNYTIGYQTEGCYCEMPVSPEGIDQRLSVLDVELLERSRMDTIAPEDVPEAISHFVSDLTAAVEAPAEASSAPVGPDDTLSYAQKLETVLSALYYAQMYVQDLFLDCKQMLHALQQAESVDRQKVLQLERLCNVCCRDMRYYSYFRDHPAVLVGPMPSEE